MANTVVRRGKILPIDKVNIYTKILNKLGIYTKKQYANMVCSNDIWREIAHQDTKELNRKKAILRHPTMARAMYNLHHKMKKTSPHRLEEIIRFTYAQDIKGLTVGYAPLKTRFDVACNLPIIWERNKSDFYKSLEDFVEALKLFLPIEEYEIVDNKFLNIRFPQELRDLQFMMIRDIQEEKDYQDNKE